MANSDIRVVEVTPPQSGGIEPLLRLPQRTVKPRVTGITSTHEVGVPIGELAQLLDDYGDFVDIAKLGIGSAYVTPNLRDKIALYREHGVHPYFGGTLFEKFYAQDRFEAYLDYLRDHDVSWIEISTGTIDIALEIRLAMVARLKDEFTVLAEIGSKDATKVMRPSQWICDMKALLEEGCSYVITEGRASGTAGIYWPSGELRTGLVNEIIGAIDPGRIIFEAPEPKRQMHFINEVGPNVNLGNVPPREVLVLEAQRVGLRSETFHIDPKR